MDATNPDRRTAGRTAAALFFATGVLLLVTTLTLPGFHRPAGVAVAVVVLGVGAAARILPWERWPRRTLVVLAVVAVAIIGIGDRVVGPSPANGGAYAYAAFFVAIFVGIGLTQPRGTAVAFAPAAALGYVVPLLTSPQHPAGAAASAAITVPLCVLVGETIAWALAGRQAAFDSLEEARALLADAAVRDPLTGVGNRRHGAALLEELASGDAVLLIDADRFKAVNDAYGHAAGDRVLAALGAHLRTALREVDAVARWGGEEFLVVLRGPDAPAPRATAERLLEGWRAGGHRTTFSVGLALHRPGRPPAATLEAADRALYAAKAAGRDRACEEERAGPEGGPSHPPPPSGPAGLAPS